MLLWLARAESCRSCFTGLLARTPMRSDLADGFMGRDDAVRTLSSPACRMIKQILRQREEGREALRGDLGVSRRAAAEPKGSQLKGPEAIKAG